jgi:hypothetical protein
MTTTTMMKVLARGFVLALGFAMVGCAADADPTEDNNDDLTAAADGTDPDEESEEAVGTSESAASKGTLKDCIKVVERSHYQSGVRVHFTVKVQNRCSSQKLGIDLAAWPDPKCQSIGNGQTATFKYSLDVAQGDPFRKVKKC